MGLRELLGDAGPAWLGQFANHGSNRDHPELCRVLLACPTDVMLRSFTLGVIRGIGGLSFELGIRYIGFSLSHSIAIGFSGALTPLAWNLTAGLVWEIAAKSVPPPD